MRGAARPTLAVIVIALVLGCGSSSTPSPSPRPTSPLGPTRPPVAAPAPSATPPAETGSPGPGTALEAEGPTTEAQRGRVVSVTDGDTVRVRIEGTEYPVRYIGIDAPERGNDPIARDATRANARLVDGERVWLERDVSETDLFDRLLRHVWLRRGGGWLLVSAEIVRRGLAHAQSYPPDTRYDALLADAQLQAQEAGAGLWAAGESVPTDPSATALPPPGLLDPPGRSANCDPAYPDVCIPRPPPDLDCHQVPYRRFAVRPPDPHNFDGDFDGIGCESG